MRTHFTYYVTVSDGDVVTEFKVSVAVAETKDRVVVENCCYIEWQQDSR